MIEIPARFQPIPPGTETRDLGNGLVGAVVTDASGNVVVALDAAGVSE